MEDTREIADTLVDRSTVVLNLEGIDVGACTENHRFYIRCMLLSGRKPSEGIQLYLYSWTGRCGYYRGSSEYPWKFFHSVCKSRLLINMEKEEFFIKRIRELANLSYRRDIVTFSDFLN